MSTTQIESIDDVTSETIVAWRDELTRSNIAASTRALRFTAVRLFFRTLSEHRIIANGPAAGVAQHRER